MTDVTGFGMLGHTLEMARGAGLDARIEMGRVPLLPGVLQLAESGCVTGASGRNWAGYGAAVTLAKEIDATRQALLTDPQTAGGLLVACAPELTQEVLALFRAHGFTDAVEIGGMSKGTGQVRVLT
jgi:selenide,water dikinase